MASRTKVVEAVYRDGVLKPLQVLDLPDNIHVWVQVIPITRKEVSAQEERFKLHLFELGLLREIRAPLGKLEGERIPIRVKGKPLSQVIIEERR